MSDYILEKIISSFGMMIVFIAGIYLGTNFPAHHWYDYLAYILGWVTGTAILVAIVEYFRHKRRKGESM